MVAALTGARTKAADLRKPGGERAREGLDGLRSCPVLGGRLRDGPYGFVTGAPEASSGLWEHRNQFAQTHLDRLVALRVLEGALVRREP